MKNLYLTIVLLSLLSAHSGWGQEEQLVATGAELEQLSAIFEFTEGPASDAQGNVYFTDQPNDRILKWSASDGEISQYMQPAGRSNGLYFDHDGTLLAAADEAFELWRIDTDKNVTVLLNSFADKKLNGPNDIWVAPDGGIYFTDPYYQRPYWSRTAKEIAEENVYYLPVGGELELAADGLQQPNGIIGTPDGKTLYVADIVADKTYAYTIGASGKLIDKKLFCELGSDGMTIDNKGNIYLTGDGVTVFSAEGVKLLHIPVPQKWTANVTFGGENQDILFITAMNSLYALKMNVHGVRWPAP